MNSQTKSIMLILAFIAFILGTITMISIFQRPSINGYDVIKILGYIFIVVYGLIFGKEKYQLYKKSLIVKKTAEQEWQQLVAKAKKLRENEKRDKIKSIRNERIALIFSWFGVTTFTLIMIIIFKQRFISAIDLLLIVFYIAYTVYSFALNYVAFQTRNKNNFIDKFVNKVKNKFLSFSFNK